MCREAGPWAFAEGGDQLCWVWPLSVSSSAVCGSGVQPKVLWTRHPDPSLGPGWLRLRHGAWDSQPNRTVASWPSWLSEEHVSDGVSSFVSSVSILANGVTVRADM